MYGTEIRFKTKSTVSSVYLAPISDKGWVAAWGGKHSDYQGGFVLRLLWLGVVVRWARIALAARKRRRIERVLEEASNNGGYYDFDSQDFT